MNLKYTSPNSKFTTNSLKTILIMFFVLIYNPIIHAFEEGGQINSGDSVFSIFIILEENTMTESKFKTLIKKSLDEINLTTNNKFVYDPVKIKSGVRLFLYFSDQVSFEAAEKISKLLVQKPYISSATPNYPGQAL